MCGLVGYISFRNILGGFKSNLSGYLTQGIYVGGVRGRDSTGMFMIEKDAPEFAEVIKSPVDGSVFVDQYNVQQTLANITDYSSIIVHHRKATRGATNTANAHPFTIDNVTLVHNGSLFNHRTLGGGNQYIVDSAAICHALSTHSKQEVLEQLDGSFALIWHDGRDKTINIARNSERPLAIGMVEKEDILLIASEKDMMRWLARRNDIKELTVLEPLEDNLYSWDLSNKDVKAKGYTVHPFTSKKAQWGGRTTGTATSTTRTGNASSSSAPSKTDLIKALDKYSIRVGDRIEFTGTEYYPYQTKLTHGALGGLDLGRAFETISFDVPTGDYVGAKLSGEVVGVKQTRGYPQWITVVLRNIVIVDRNYQKKPQSDVQDDIARVKEARKNALSKPKESVSKGEEGKDQSPKSYPICQYNCSVKCIVCQNQERREKQRQLALPQQPSSGPQSSGRSSTPSAAQTKAANDDDKEDKTPDFVIGPNNIWITVGEWANLTKHGCSYCSCDLLSPADVKWTYDGDPLCYECDRMYTYHSHGYFN